GERGGEGGEAHRRVVDAAVLAQGRDHTKADAERHDQREGEDADGRGVRPAASDQLDDGLALVLVGEPEVEVEHVPDVERELLVDGPVEPVLPVQVVDHDLGELSSAGLVPRAARGEVHEGERDDDVVEDDMYHQEDTDELIAYDTLLTDVPQRLALIC